MEPNQIKNPHRNFAHYFKEVSMAPYLFALSKKMSSGHICIVVDKIPSDKDFWDEFEKNFNSKIHFTPSPTLVGNTADQLKPFTLDGKRLYLSRNFYYETLIVDKLRLLSQLDVKVKENRKAKLKNHLEFVTTLQSQDSNIDAFSTEEKPDWQLVAAIQGMLNNITIVTGGPGTGKTTTVAKILALLHKTEKDLRIALTAPTGKAAVRMKESLMNTVEDERNKDLGIKELVNDAAPKTIHRLLGNKRDSNFFKHNHENPLDFNVLIVDEASMIGVGLFAKLLDAVAADTRIILLGDSEQLASVDSGSLFGDICKGLEANENKFDETQLLFLNQFIAKERILGKKYLLESSNSFLDQHLVRLKKTYRYDQNSKMGQFTKAVIEGDIARMDIILKIPEDSLVLDETYDSKLLENFVQGYASYIEEKDTELALEKINALRVLCALRNGDQGIYELNRRIVAILKNKYAESGKLFSPQEGFYHNQPIMVARNMSSMNLYNGDVGIIRKDNDGNLKAYFPPVTGENKSKKELIEINPALITEWETVFAMTIHKSQGSEFDEVLVILPQKGGGKLQTSELHDTGVAPAKNKAIIQSSLELIKQTSMRRVDRVSGIQERIK